MADELAREVWNRACSLFPGDGDAPARDCGWALAGAILLDGVVQNGGLVSAVPTVAGG